MKGAFERRYLSCNTEMIESWLKKVIVLILKKGLLLSRSDLKALGVTIGLRNDQLHLEHPRTTMKLSTTPAGFYEIDLFNWTKDVVIMECGSCCSTNAEWKTFRVYYAHEQFLESRWMHESVEVTRGVHTAVADTCTFGGCDPTQRALCRSIWWLRDGSS